MNETVESNTKTEGLIKAKGMASRTVWPFYGLGLLLMACLWLPVAKGCNGSLVYPVENVRCFEPGATAMDIFGSLSLLLIYGNGLSAAFLLTLAALFATRTWWWNAFHVEFICTLVWVGIAFGFQLFNTIESYREMLEFVLYDLVTLAVALAWIGKAWMQQRPFQAWARLRYTWVLGAMFVVQMSCLFGSAQIGYYVSMIALVGLAFSIERASRRMEHDLWDPSAAVVPFQFSLWNIFVWMTFPPVAVAYFVGVNKIVEWLFD
ncbi:MAG: hypothetical protein U0905_14180 [Pirellulales bacterium]